MRNNSVSERLCPGCNETKTFQNRNETCGKPCADKLKKQRASAVAPAAKATRTVDQLVDDTRYKKENEDLRRQLNEALTKHVVDTRFQRFVARVADSGPVRPAPKWTVPASSGNKHNVIPTAFLSDQHFDEVVDPAQVNGVNAYNREIAETRLKNFFTRSVKLGTRYFAGLNYPGICVPMGGDNFSGNIHDELRRTNEGTLCEAILHWIEPTKVGLTMLADAYGKVYAPGVVGNHSRMTQKPIAKGRVRDNVDWLFYMLLKRELSGDPRITIAVSEAPDFQYSLFGTRFCLTHGDQFKGGSGIAGLLSPMMLGDARKRKRAQAINLPYDYLIMGHWHQLTQARNVIINGSLKGYDEYAFNSNFDYEPPQQAFFLTSAERRAVWGFTPIHVTDVDDPYCGNRKISESAPIF